MVSRARAIEASSLASDAPRQWCGPPPNETCWRAFSRSSLGVDERGQQVIGGVGALPRDHVGRYGGELGVRGVDGRGERRIGDGLQPADHRAAQLPDPLVRDFREAHGRQVGVKPAGGIRTAKDAIKYLVLVNETAGEDWLDPRWFRLGASSLLNDLLMQRTKLATGRYSGPDYFTLD